MITSLVRAVYRAITGLLRLSPAQERRIYSSNFNPRLHQSSSIMGDKSKSDTEWRAILSPEQVCCPICHIMYTDSLRCK